MTLALALLRAAQNDQAQVNGRDDAGESAWVAHSRAVYTTTKKKAGMVLHLGDSITRANLYGQWARHGAGGEEAATTSWCLAGQAFPSSPTATDKDGFYLCAVDVANLSMTAAGVHPTGGASAADPYSPGGNAAAYRTGSNAAADGYLLRSWLRVQKLKEVKSYVADGGHPFAPAPAPPPATASSSSSDDDGGGCSCGTARGAPALAAAVALLLLAAGLRR